jgi:hypothetical protein
MKRSLFLPVVGLAVVAFWGLVSPAPARADIPPLPVDLPAGKTPVPIEVSYDQTKDITFLYIGNDVLASAARDNKDKQGFHAPGAARSIVAALALSLGVAGIFLLRGKRTAQAACGLVMIVGLGALGAEAWGNAAPPIKTPPPGPPATTGRDLRPKTFNGDAVVEIVDGDGSYHVRLVIGTKPKPKYVRPGPPPAPEKKPEKAT